MLKKVVYAGAQSASFVQASKDLEALAETTVSRERVQRWTKRVGQERVAAATAAAERYRDLPLPERRTSPTGQVPQVACIEMDGGRIQIRQRAASSGDKPSSYWRESLVACLSSMTSQEHTADPCPRLPKAFVDPRRMSDLAREIKGFSSETAIDEPAPDAPVERAERPELRVRSVIATRQGLEALGLQAAAAAQARGFNAARRKAFLGDGSSSNWSVHRQQFSHYTPILDFTHAICYVYQAAMAGRSPDVGWEDYCRWAQWLWGGQTDELIQAVAMRAAKLGPPADSDPETSPRQIVAKVLGYLQNQRSRMRYHEYRRLGLPITTSHVESAIKQVNRRVKGTEKFWDQGAEPLLQLVADHLSETQPLATFWRQRPRQLSSMRCRTPA
jgi:hypothetical protein